MTIQSLVRAVGITSLFKPHQPELGITEIAAQMGLNKATAWGLVTTLVETGLLAQNTETRKYHLGSLCYDLGMFFAATLDINRLAMEPIHRLADRINFTTRLGIWDRNSLLVTLVAMAHGREAMAPQIGPRVLAHCTAIGKAALAFIARDALEKYLAETRLESLTPSTITQRQQLMDELDEIRKKGYSVGRQELIIGRAGIGAPVFEKTGKFAGAISVHGTAKDILEEKFEVLITEIRATAAEISARLGYYPTSVYSGAANKPIAP
jgi:DNA-binding IclR family transcriptional regulator